MHNLYILIMLSYIQLSNISNLYLIYVYNYVYIYTLSSSIGTHIHGYVMTFHISYVCVGVCVGVCNIKFIVIIRKIIKGKHDEKLR